MKPNPAWSAFWTLLALTALVGELVAIATNGATSSFSAQVWFILGLSPWVWSVGVAVFGGGAAWLFVHFFMRQRQP